MNYFDNQGAENTLVTIPPFIVSEDYIAFKTDSLNYSGTNAKTLLESGSYKYTLPKSTTANKYSDKLFDGSIPVNPKSGLGGGYANYVDHMA